MTTQIGEIIGRACLGLKINALLPLKIGQYSLLLSSTQDAHLEGREHHGVGLLLRSLLIPHTLCWYQGHSRITGVILNTHPLKLLILSCYAPTAPHPEAEKMTFYNKLREILEENRTTIPILLGDWNTKLSQKEPEDYGIGENIFPTAYPLHEMPEDTYQNRAIFLDFLAAKSLTAVNTTHLLPENQRVTYRTPGTPSFVGPWEPHLFAQVDYILTKTGFNNGFSAVYPLRSWANDSDHLPLIAKFCWHLAYGRKRKRLPSHTRI